MSLREFAIVTRLNCRKIPEPTKKRKNPPKEKLYWNELLGSLKFCTVDTAIDMLKKKVVKSKEARIKFACLAITSSILFPSSHTPRIIPEHVELIRHRTVIVDSESENPNEDLALEDDNAVPHDKPSEATKYCLIPGHAKSIDIECQGPVKSILDEPYEEWFAGLDFSWVDESEDLAVENMVRLICEGFSYQKEMFKGGLNASDLLHLRGVKKLKEKEPKEKNDKYHAAKVTDGEGSDSQAHILIANLVASQLVDKFNVPPPTYMMKSARWRSDIDKKIGVALVGQLKICKLRYSRVHNRPPVNGNLPVVPDTSTPSEAADFRISEVLRDLNIVPDHFLPPNTDVDLPRKTPERGGSYADDNLDAELDTANGSSIQISIAADSQLSVEQREVQVEDLVAANNITEQDIDKKIGVALVGQLKICKLRYSRVHNRPPVNGNLPVVPDTSTPSEAADFRISEVLRDLNIVPDHFLPPNTDVDLPRKTPERGGSYADDNLDAELDTANGSSIQISIAADSQLSVEQREVQVEDLVAANNITEQTGHILDANKTPNLENNQSLGVSTMVVEKPVSQEFVMEEMHIPFYLHDKPSFSLGLSQENAPGVEESPNPTNYVSPPKAHEEEAPEPRKSKRSRIIPAGLQDYKCDPKVKAGLCIIPDVDHRFTLMEQKVMKESEIKLPNGYSMPSLELCDIAYRTTILPTGVIDTLIGFVSRGPMVGPNVAIYDTTLPVTLMNHNNRFVKTAVKDRSKLKFADVPLEKHLEKSHERIYFPFNMDKQHWVGVCIDTKACTLHVLDCNTSFRSDSSLEEDLNSIAALLPYVLKQFGFLGTNAGVKAFTVSRCQGIPQVSNQNDSGVMTVLLIETHAGDGFGACKAITPRLLPDASKQLAVKLFDDISM
ncbi:hypothetical protein F2Q69_00055850 [Brassica cretica]|uniref:Ubiquitin-like protease family profile domain-containing protein n=1 Tax=Brassica cretica TaxID=69181 RepID=A0A8S9MWT4_BRACR|nr:hypothetical protein F2Q69_00055850 [Brassica cretica]